MLEEDFRPGEYYEVVEDEHGGYMLNSKDMCLLPRLPDLLGIGMDSLKVEGRNKTEYYAAVVARAYRQAIDDWYKAPQDWNFEKYMPDLNTLQNRGYCLGFHDGPLTNISQNYEYTRTLGDWLLPVPLSNGRAMTQSLKSATTLTAANSSNFCFPARLITCA